MMLKIRQKMQKGGETLSLTHSPFQDSWTPASSLLCFKTQRTIKIIFEIFLIPTLSLRVIIF